MLFVSIYQYV